MNLHDPYIVLRDQRYPFAWDEGGAHWEGCPIPTCADCGELLMTTRKRVQIGRDQAQRQWVECDCGARFPVEHP